jgi:tRNA dimethylallyltransferase
VGGVAAVAARLVSIVGPTASGKTALGVALARAVNGEIVSCDSLQVYRGLDIGSAKPTVDEREGVPHHLIDIRAPDEVFSAADYARLAREAVAAIGARGHVPLLVGGTGLYLRALLVGLFEGPSRNEELRRRLEATAERWGNARLHRLLRRVDDEAAARIHPSDRLRIVRALEVFKATGRPLSKQRGEGFSPLVGWDVLVVGLDPPREELRQRLEQRTRVMFARGLLAEVQGLLDRGYAEDLRPLRAIGYRQAVDVLRGRSTVEEAQQRVVVESLQYAKRQRTWFRHQADVQWFPSPDAALAAARDYLRTSIS